MNMHECSTYEYERKGCLLNYYTNWNYLFDKKKYVPKHKHFFH